MKILMVAAENGALDGGKVGGMGDVIRDIPRALSRLDHQVDVVMPGYQKFSRLPGTQVVAELVVNFRGEDQALTLSRLPSDENYPNLCTWVVDHPMLAPLGDGRIYCDDEPGKPFATDASKFALFCIGVAQALIEKHLGEPEVIHLHDWHTALLAVLAHYHPRYHSLGDTRMVYTIHNLSLQGIRPFSWDDSALENWYRQLAFDYEAIRDPRYENCYNPMRAAINLCHKVHGVSPTYIGEIQKPSQPELGFVGGEGLEDDLRRAAEEGRLVGILNGCEYGPEFTDVGGLDDCLVLMEEMLRKWRLSGDTPERHDTALARVARWRGQREAGDCSGLVLTSIGRISDQKVRLLQQPMQDGRSALEHLLDRLDEADRLVLLGSGDKGQETFFASIAEARANLIFLCGYSEPLSLSIYANGDLFLMPSSFEPCGISQMLAMRAGQPCLVHHVGGLVDTVADGINGFAFTGDSPLQQAENMVRRLESCLALSKDDPDAWGQIGNAAEEVRFLWSGVAEQYIAELYH